MEMENDPVAIARGSDTLRSASLLAACYATFIPDRKIIS